MPSLLHETGQFYLTKELIDNKYSYFCFKGNPAFIERCSAMCSNYGLGRKFNQYSEDIYYVMVTPAKLREILTQSFIYEVIQERDALINYYYREIEKEGEMIVEMGWDEAVVEKLAAGKCEKFLTEVVRMENILRNLYSGVDRTHGDGLALGQINDQFDN
jgi:hypothetical protein